MQLFHFNIGQCYYCQNVVAATKPTIDTDRCQLQPEFAIAIEYGNHAPCKLRGVGGNSHICCVVTYQVQIKRFCMNKDEIHVATTKDRIDFHSILRDGEIELLVSPKCDAGVFSKEIINTQVKIISSLVIETLLFYMVELGGVALLGQVSRV